MKCPKCNNQLARDEEVTGVVPRVGFGVNPPPTLIYRCLNKDCEYGRIFYPIYPQFALP